MTKFSRRKIFKILLAGLGLTSVSAGALLYSRRIQSISTASEDIQKERIRSGYIVRVDETGDLVAPGWGVNPGDRIGLALSGHSRKSIGGSIVFTDAAGHPSFSVENVVLRRQALATEQPWLNGAGFNISGTGKVPSNLPSGVYFAADESELFVVVKEKQQQSSPKSKRMVVLVSTNTFNAYSKTDQRSLYAHPIAVPAVSFYRPQNRAKPDEWRPFLDWLVSEEPFGSDIDIAYITDFEMDDPRILEGADLLVVLGHSEYWTRRAREVFDAFVGRGGHVLIAAGNTMWWQVRYEGEKNEVLVSYKSDSKNDPLAGTEGETTNWDEEVLNYPVIPSIGGCFRQGGFGIFRRPKRAKGWGGYLVIDPSHPLLRSTGLREGDCIPFFELREYDGAPILGFDANGMPVADLEQIGAHKFELLGFDIGYRAGHTVATMHVMQRTPTSGYIFNLGAKDFARTWARGDMEPWRRSTDVMKQIFKNFVSDVLSNRAPFSLNQRQAKMVYRMTTPWKGELPAGLPWRSERPTCQPTGKV